MELLNLAASCIYTAACPGSKQSGSSGAGALRKAAAQAAAALDTAQRLWQKEFRPSLPACAEVAALVKVGQGKFVPGQWKNYMQGKQPCFDLLPGQPSQSACAAANALFKSRPPQSLQAGPCCEGWRENSARLPTVPQWRRRCTYLLSSWTRWVSGQQSQPHAALCYYP